MTIRQAANPQVDIVRPISGLRTLKTFVAEAAPMKKAIERTVKIFEGLTTIVFNMPLNLPVREEKLEIFPLDFSRSSLIYSQLFFVDWKLCSKHYLL